MKPPGPVPTRTILFVSSGRQATPAADATSHGFVQLELGALTPQLIADASAVIFNVELGNPADLAAIRAATASLKTRPPLLFVVDRGAPFHHQATQANALGARAVIRRPLDRLAIDNALNALFVPPPVRAASLERIPGGKSVAAAQRIIGASFAALSSGAPLKVDDAAAASQELFAGVGQVGLHAWLDIVRAHHDGTFQHCLLVTGAAVAYANHAALSDEVRVKLTMAALLHDIGKAEIPNAILDKPGKLTPEEFAVIRQHPRTGADYLTRQGTLPPEVIEPVLHHHEYLDGSGYPDGLRGDEIGLMTRILTVCDIYGAMVEQRAYKPARSQSEALYLLLGMAQSGKVDGGIVQILAAALGAKLASDASDQGMRASG